MANPTRSKFNPEEWFENNIQLFESLAANVANTLKTALDKQNIMYVDVPFRAKTKESFLKKWQEKKYTNTESMMDMAGVRVITLVEDDLHAVEKLIRQLFLVHEEDSGDKSVGLGHDKFGYRSKHFVCDIGAKREQLIELEHFKGKRFEIQIRTALAHAWAEIEHDRGYKLEGGLPENLKRRLNLVAGLLESADNEFNRLTKDIAEYAVTTSQKVQNSELDLELTSISLKELLHSKYSKYLRNDWQRAVNSKEFFEEIKNELALFGVHSIKDVDILIESTLQKNPQLEDWRSYDVGFIRDILMLSDIQKYDENGIVWSGATESVSYRNLISIYEESTVNEIFEKNQIYVSDDDCE